MPALSIHSYRLLPSYSTPQNHVALPPHLAGLEPFLDVPYEKTLVNKELDKALGVSARLIECRNCRQGAGRSVKEDGQ